MNEMDEMDEINKMNEMDEMDEIKKILENIKMKKVNGEKFKEDLIKESVIIRKSDLEKLGKELIKEIDNFLHDEYILTFPEMKLDQEQFDESVNIYKDKYESGSLNLHEMYDIFVKIKLDEEIDGDLYFKKEGYLNLFQVLFINYIYLEN